MNAQSGEGKRLWEFLKPRIKEQIDSGEKIPEWKQWCIEHGYTWEDFVKVIHDV